MPRLSSSPGKRDICLAPHALEDPRVTMPLPAVWGVCRNDSDLWSSWPQHSLQSGILGLWKSLNGPKPAPRPVGFFLRFTAEGLTLLPGCTSPHPETSLALSGETASCRLREQRLSLQRAQLSSFPRHSIPPNIPYNVLIYIRLSAAVLCKNIITRRTDIFVLRTTILQSLEPCLVGRWHSDNTGWMNEPFTCRQKNLLNMELPNVIMTLLLKRLQ